MKGFLSASGKNKCSNTLLLQTLTGILSASGVSLLQTLMGILSASGRKTNAPGHPSAICLRFLQIRLPLYSFRGCHGGWVGSLIGITLRASTPFFFLALARLPSGHMPWAPAVFSVGGFLDYSSTIVLSFQPHFFAEAVLRCSNGLSWRQLFSVELCRPASSKAPTAYVVHCLRVSATAEGEVFALCLGTPGKIIVLFEQL